MLSVQRVSLMSQPSFGKRDNSQFDEAEIINDKPKNRRTLTPEQKERMKLARAEAKRLREEEKAYNQAVDQWEGVHDNLESLEDLVPEKIRKPYKWLKVGSSAVVTGLGVVWASKKAGNATKSALTSDFSKKAGKAAMSTFETIKKPFVTAYKHVSDFAGKKLSGTKTEKVLDNVKDKALNNKAVEFVTEKYAEAQKYVKSKVDKVTFDKVNNITAGVLGTGSGLAAGYEVARGDS